MEFNFSQNYEVTSTNQIVARFDDWDWQYSEFADDLVEKLYDYCNKNIGEDIIESPEDGMFLIYVDDDKLEDLNSFLEKLSDELDENIESESIYEEDDDIEEFEDDDY